LCDRHPPAPSDRNPPSDPSKVTNVQFTVEDVTSAIRSFPAGSTGGPYGVRPQHLRDLTSNKETGTALITASTAFINLLMQGKCPPSVTQFIFGGRLIALQKKAGGIRPIAIGYTLRLLAAKCVNKYAITISKDAFAPFQLGVGVLVGCEAAVHATRRFLSSMSDKFVVAKIDFSKAFNSIRGDSVLEAVSASVPEIYGFCCLAYQNTSILQFGQRTIASDEGVQQGDPLGPLLFCLTTQPLLSSLASNLTIGFSDDFTIGGHLDSVAADIATIKSSGASLGLSLNSVKE
jgi:Reverse transcriptase (RNA-dependent DNA polymerase)